MFKKLYLFLTLLTAFLWLGSGTMWGDELTVANGTGTNAYVPFYGYYADQNGMRSQIIYLASDIEAMDGGTISGITFYSSSNSWTNSATFTVSLAEVDVTSLSAIDEVTSLTAVKTGYTLSVNASGEMEITFDTPFEYADGKNLLVDLTMTKKGSEQSKYYYGVTASGASYLKYGSSGSTTAPGFRPKATFTYTPPVITCHKPTDLTKGTVTSSSAAFTWSAGSDGESEWQYICLPKSTTLDWTSGDVQTITSTSASINGLSANTAYKFYVRGNCGLTNGYSRAASLEFRTECGAIATASLPYELGFETGEECAVGNKPPCWSKIGSSSVIANSGYTTYAKTGTQALHFNGTAEQYAVLPQFETEVKNLQISFWYKNYYPSYYPSNLVLGTMTDPADKTTFTEIKPLDQKDSYIHIEDESLASAPAGDYYIAFKYTATNSSAKIMIDDLSVSALPSCTKPASINEATSITTTGATITWAEGNGETQWQYVVLAAGAEESWASGTVIVNSREAVLTGLTPETSYDFYVRSYCGASEQSGLVKTTFTTECAKKSIPWTCGFEESEGYATGSYSSTAPNKCWAILNMNGSLPYAFVNTNSTYVRTGSKSLYFESATERDGYIIFPELDAALNTLQIEFYHKEESATKSSTLTLGYMTDITDASSFVALKEDPFTRVADTWSHEEESLAGVPAGVASTARLAFKVGKTSNSNWYLGIDDITISVLPSCPKPTNLAVSSLKYNGATVTWNAGGSETSWILKYTDNKELGWASVTENPLTERTYTFTNLTPGTTYYATVQAGCEGDLSDEISFIPQCVTPSGLAVNSKTSTTATIGWTVNSGETEWNVQYKKNSDADWTTVAGVTSNPYTIEGLTAGKNYQVKVAAACNGTYTSAVSFETECGESPIAPLGYTEGFEDFATGSTTSTGLLCWAELNASHTSYSYPQMYVSTNSTYVHSGSKTLYFVSSDSKYIYAILPAFSGSYNGLQLTFWHKEEDASQSGHITLGYMTDPADASTFTAITQSAYTRATSWNEETEVLSGVPAGARLAFRYGGASNNYYAGIDDISITTAPNCVKPTAVTASSVSNSSASISWTNGGEETSWKLQYSTDNTNWTAANGGEAFTTKPFALEGLAANTTYYVQVKAVCGGSDGESDWSLAGNFTTDCNAVELADFTKQEFASTVPDCWRFTKTGGNDWTPSSTYKVSASYSMDYYAPTATSNYSDMTTPSITLTEDANLKFQLRNYYYGSEATGEVYIVTSSATTKLLDFPVTTSSFALQTIDLSDYTNQTVKFIFRGHGAGEGKYAHIYIDDVEVAAKPCDAPTALTKVETSSSVVISWTDDAASKWNLQWREVGATDWNTVENLTVKNYALTNSVLTFGKTYEAQVQAVCTDVKSSDWSSSISFGLVCGAAPSNLTVSARTTNSATLTWEGTENAFKLQTSLDGENWEEAINVNAKTYDLTGLSAAQTYYARVQNACGGDYATVSFKTWCGLADAAELPLNVTSFTALPECWEATFKGEWSGISGNKICFYGTEEQWVVLPAYDINLNKLSVTFTYTTNSATADFGYLDAPNDEFHAFASQPVSGEELDLAAEAAAAKYIAVRYNGGSSDYNNVTISSIVLRKTPNCLKPTDVAGTPGVGSASISWTENGSAEAWNLQYKTGSADWTTVAVTENPYNLSGLEQGLTYKVRVQAACAGEDPSDWSDEASFTTDCDAVSALPFIETFDAALSNCWDITDDDVTTYAHSVYGSELRLPGGKVASGHLVVLPEITASLTNAVLTIEYTASTGANTAVPQMGYIDGEGAFQEIATLDKSNTTTEARIALASYTGKRLALRYDDGTSEGNFDIAEIRILDQVTLADNTNIYATLAAYNGKAADITIGRTIVRKGYFNTICLPFSLSAEELAASPIASDSLWAFKYAKVEGDELLFRIVEADHIEAGVPYFIYYDNNAEDIVSPLFKNVTISATSGQEVGNDVAKLCGIIEKPVVFNAGDQTKLFLAANNTLYWWNGGAASQLNNFRAYFKVATGGGANNAPRHGMKARIIRQEEVATGVENVQLDAQAIKLIENGNVVIIRNGVKYNIQGQVISK